MNTQKGAFSPRVALAVVWLLLILTGSAIGNTISSSTMQFQGALTDNGNGTYTGVVPMIVGGGFDIFAEEGATAYFGDDSVAAGFRKL